jgi:hypothetical protein
MFLFSGIARVFIVFGMVPKLIDIIHNFGRNVAIRQNPRKPSMSSQWGLYYSHDRDVDPRTLKSIAV